MMDSNQLKQINEYNVLNRINEGVSAVVYLVEHEGLEFALKLLKSSDGNAIIRFRRESSSLARLNDENLIKIYDVGEYLDSVYLVTEYLSGLTVEQKMDNGALDEETAVKITSSVAKALHEIHSHNLVHRDVKPANIFFKDTGEVKLIDLGLIGEIEQIKQETAFVGTPIYVSPEQSRVLKRDVDNRSDLYSLGATLFKMLSGKPPFDGTLNEIIQQHSSKVSPRVSTLNPDVRPSLDAIVNKLLAKDPDDRYQTAKGLIRDLGRLSEIDDLISAARDPQLDGNGEGTDRAVIPFVERSPEFSKLNEAWRQVCNSNSTFAVVTGPSGCGKSRLMSEFLQSIKSERLLAFSFKCDSNKAEVPFAPFRSSFENLINVIAANANPQDLESLRKAVVGYESELVSLTPSFKKICGDIQAPSSISDPESEKELFLGSLCDFILSLNNHWDKIVFLLDDIHFLDMSSIQLIKKVMENAASRRIIFLATTGEDEGAKKRVELIQEAAGTRFFGTIELGPFNREQSARLIHNYLGAHKIADGVVETIGGKAGGSPFVLVEYLRQAIEQGYLRFRSSHWNLDDSKQRLQFTSDVIDIFLKRYEKCDTETRGFLQRAAVCGIDFSSEDIQWAFSFDRSVVAHALTQAAKQGVIEQTSATRWHFAHEKISSSIAGKLSEETACQYYATLASHISKKSDLTSDEIFLTARLSHQAEKLLAPDMVVEAQIRAGEFAMSNHAHNEAFTFLQCGLSVLETMAPSKSLKLKVCRPLAICASAISEHDLALKCVEFVVQQANTKVEMFDAVALRMWILINASKLVEAWETYKVAVKMLGRPHPVYLHLKMMHIVWSWFFSILHEFVPVTRRPEKYFGIPVNVEKVATLYRLSTYVTQITSSTLDSCILSLRLLRAGQITGDAKTKAVGYSYVGYLCSLLGLRVLYSSYFSRALRLCERLNNPTLSAACEMRRLLGSAYCGVSNNYVPDYTKFMASFQRYLPPAELSLLRSMSGLFFGFRGLHEEAIKTYKSILQSYQTRTMLVTPHALSIVLQQLWFNLAAVGHNQESLKVKAVAFEENNKLRFSPATSRQGILAELTIGRLSLKLDNTVDELVKFFTGSLQISIAEPIQSNYLGNAGYLRLCQFRSAVSTEEKFAMGHEIRRILTRLSVTMYSPVFRANYLYLCGALYGSLNNQSRSQYFLRKAEEVASETGNLLVLFEIQIERARHHLKRGNLELMKLSLSSAFNLASKHSWKLALDRLLLEFEPYLDFPKSVSSSRTSLTSASDGTIQSVTGDEANRTTMGTNSTASASVLSSASQLGGMDYQGQRIVEATLNVSKAFVTSIDSTAQSKAVLMELIKLFGAERGFIFATDSNTDGLKPIAGISSQNTDLKNIKSYSTTVVRKVFDEQKAIVLSGTDEAEAMGSDSAVLYNLRSIMATPLSANGKPLGVVYLDTSLTKGLFTKSDVDLFNTLGSQISVALELSRMTQVELEKANLKRELDIQSAIAHESKKVKILVDNMQQALFSVENTEKIVEPVSRYSTAVFGNDIVNANVFDVLFSEFKNDPEKIDALKSTITSVFGESELQWDLMESNFPRKIHLNRQVDNSYDSTRTLRIQPSPIWDDEQNLERILFVAEDVTDLEALEKQVNQHREQSALLSDVLESPRDQIRDFFATSASVLRKIRSLCGNLTDQGPDEIKRDLHTLKGNARLVKLMVLSKQIHESENELLKVNGNPAEIAALVVQELNKIESLQNKYLDLLNRLFPENQSDSAQLGANPLAIEYLDKMVTSLSGHLSRQEGLGLQMACERLNFRSLAKVASRFDAMVKDLARQLSKSVQFEVSGEALASKDQVDQVQEVLLHLVRNSLDHGLETSAERVQAGKPEVGRVKIEFVDDVETISVSITDDGRGLDGDKIAARAIEKGLVSKIDAEAMTDQQKRSLIFRPGFSTKTEATEISGRGIGMDVVLKNVERMGGKIEIDTELGNGSTFRFRVNTAYLGQTIERKVSGG